jgi:uncharacterized protein YdhG (YjbR/CyaY superfamily)
MSTIDDYVQGLPDDRRTAFEQVCAVVRQAVPDAEEGKSYGLPAFRWKGRPLLGFRAFKDHLSVMPFSAEVVAAVADRLEGFHLSKGSVRFSPDRSIPEEVLLEMIRLRQAELSR